MTVLQFSPGSPPDGLSRSDELASSVEGQGGSAFPGVSTELFEAVIRRLRPLHEARACREFLEAFPRLLGDGECLPTQAAVSARLQALTGFRIEPADGVASPREFFAALARRVFLATPSLRPAGAPFFAPAPDWIHDLIGHAVFLAHPLGAELYRLFGFAYRPTMSDAEVARLASAFWYVAEAGVVREGGRWKALGGALLSSVEELGGFRSVDVRAFDPGLVAELPFDDSRCQHEVFGARSVLELQARLRQHFGLGERRTR